jgi:hypothetical protein
MAAVADPVIARVGALLRQCPQALSLAQGMVGWGPPREALATLAAAGKAVGAADPTRDAYGPVQGDPELLAMLAVALGQEQGIDLHGADLRRRAHRVHLPVAELLVVLTRSSAPCTATADTPAACRRSRASRGRSARQRGLPSARGAQPNAG